MAWNGSSGDGRTTSMKSPRGGGTGASSKRSYFRVIVAGAIIVVVGVVALWYFGGRGATSPTGKSTVKKPTVISEVKPATAAPVAQLDQQPKRLTREEMLFEKTNGYVKAAGKMLTDDGRVLTFPAPQGDEIRIVHSHGRTYQCDSQGNFIDVTPKPIFDNAFEENLVGMAVEGGAFMPGMLLGHDAGEIATMLAKQVVINPDDPEDVVAKKEAVAALKEDMLAYIKEGGTFDDYVMGMREQTVKERMWKAEGLKQIMQMVNEGDTEGAAFMRDKLNEITKSKGMSPLKLPKHVRELLGDTDATQN